MRWPQKARARALVLAGGVMIIAATLAFVPTGLGRQRFVIRWELPVLGGAPIVELLDGRAPAKWTPLFKRWSDEQPQHLPLPEPVRLQGALDQDTDCELGYRFQGVTDLWAARCRRVHGIAVDPNEWRLLLRTAYPTSIAADRRPFVTAAQSRGALASGLWDHVRGSGLLAAGAEDGAISRWEVIGESLRPLAPVQSGAAVTALRYFGRSYLAAADSDGTITVWRHGAEPVTLVNAHDGPVYGVEFARSGRLLSAGADGHVKAWDLTGPQPARDHAAHRGPIYRLVRTSDGRFLSAGYDGYVRLWGRDGQQLVAERRLHYGPIYVLGASAEGASVSAGWDGVLREWFFDAGRVRIVPYVGMGPAGDPVHSAIAISPDGQQIAINQNGRVAVWSLRRDSSPLWPDLPQHLHQSSWSWDASAYDRTEQVSFSADGQWLVFPRAKPPEAIGVRTGERRTDFLPPAWIGESRPAVSEVLAFPGAADALVRDGLVVGDVEPRYVDAAWIPSRSWTDRLLGRINLAAVDARGRTVVGYVAPAVPLPLAVLTFLVLAAVATAAIIWRRRRMGIG